MCDKTTLWTGARQRRGTPLSLRGKKRVVAKEGVEGRGLVLCFFMFVWLCSDGSRQGEKVDLKTLVNQDAGDESLRKYKEALLGNVSNTYSPKDDARRVVITQLKIVVEGKQKETERKNFSDLVFKDAPTLCMLWTPPPPSRRSRTSPLR